MRTRNQEMSFKEFLSSKDSYIRLNKRIDSLKVCDVQMSNRLYNILTRLVRMYLHSYRKSFL